jgi:hypothetical protein
MAIPSFTLAASAMMTAPAPMRDAATFAPAAAARQALPGSGEVLVISNLGPSAAMISLGGDDVLVNPAGSVIAFVGVPLVLTVDSATYCAALGTQDRAILHLAVGT